MAVKYYYFLSPTLPVATILQQLAPSAAFAVVPPVYTEAPFTVVQLGDDTSPNEEDLLAAMDSLGYTFVVSTLVAPVFARVRHHGALATPPTVPAPASGDRFYDTALGVERYYTGASWSATLSGSATVNFGANPFQATGEGNVVKVTVPATWVTASDVITVSPQAIATADHDPDDYAAEGITAYAANIVPGVSFDIIAQAANSSWGQYKISYVRM